MKSMKDYIQEVLAAAEMYQEYLLTGKHKEVFNNQCVFCQMANGLTFDNIIQGIDHDNIEDIKCNNCLLWDEFCQGWWEKKMPKDLVDSTDCLKFIGLNRRARGPVFVKLRIPKLNKQIKNLKRMLEDGRK